jgi:hypothetical protein
MTRRQKTTWHYWSAYRVLRQVAVARNFPFVVKTTVPAEGFSDQRLNAMHSFHRDHGIQLAVLPHQHDAGGNYLLWCFDSPPIAEKFAEEFSSQVASPSSLDEHSI